MALINPSLPIVGAPDSTEEAKIPTCLSQILALVNGGLDSTNIADGSIQAVDIAAALADMLGITAGGITRRGFAQVATPETTASVPRVDLATVGPSLTVTVPTNGLVIVGVQCDLSNNGGGPGSVATLMVDGAATSLVVSSASASPTTSAQIVSGLIVAGAFLAAGSHTFKLQYNVSAGPSTGTFANRKLWVDTVGF
ncbi:MAG: hypothetical protein JWO74_2306 [Solirubrobacterales bacterium]|nr:hypothetical protein [Solirubrobacterales bacterium]